MKPVVFIGYEERLPVQYEVCKHSILQTSSGPVDIFPLNHKELRRNKLFWRPWLVDPATGNYIDVQDKKPFSTQFSHSRFLTPHYARWLGYDDNQLSLFVDSDFLFVEDVYKLFEEGEHQFRHKIGDVAVCKHNFEPEKTVKMDLQQQATYPKKLWSALMLFSPRALDSLSLEDVNTQPGSYLHQFEWSSETYVKSLDLGWNFIPGHNTGTPKAIHYTHGTPDIEMYDRCELSQVYKQRKDEIRDLL